MAPVDGPDLLPFSLGTRDLWQLAHSTAPEEFQAAALRVARTLVPFGGAFWGIARAEGTHLHPHHVHLDGLSPEAIPEYEAIRDVDVVAFWTMANPGRTLHFDVRTVAPDVPESVLAFDRRHGIEQILCTMVPEPLPDLATFLSMYRAPGDPTFTEGERRAVEALMPHLCGAFAACRARDTVAPARGEGAGVVAVVDTQGLVHTPQEALTGLLRQEWPGWSGPALPPPLAALCRSGGTFKGGQIVVRVVAPHYSFTRLQARPRVPADRLSPRELEVALAFSMGMEASEIAPLLGLSVAGVRNRLRQAYATLGVSSRVELVPALAVLRAESPPLAPPASAGT
jgi:DNA-binding CsgD family transcriptional regulator